MPKRGVPRNAGDMDPAIASQAALAFYRHSQLFVDSLPADSRVTQAVASVGDLVFSATCVALSIELSLKSLLILTGRPIPATHDLVVLYEGLPDGARRTIRQANEGQGTSGPGEAVSIRLVYNGDGSEPLDGPLRDQPEGNSVEAVLERNRDAFCSWRYLHEIAQHPSPVVIDYEYRQLARIATVVGTLCHGILSGSGRPRHP